jgi:hypothetical protein
MGLGCIKYFCMIMLGQHVNEKNRLNLKLTIS